MDKASFHRYLIDGFGDAWSEDYARMIDLMRPKQYKKGAILHRAGDTCRSIFFMSSGLVRCFYVLDDKEVNLRLLCDYSVVMDLVSGITGEPSDQTIECMADCQGLELSEVAYNTLNTRVGFLQLEKMVLQRHYLSMERRLRMLQHKSLEQRYAYFVRVMEPKIVEQMPAIHIASYLGVAPESLSRIKSQLNKC